MFLSLLQSATARMDPGCQVQVALRVRDLVPRERLEGFFSCIHVSSANATVTLGGERSFAFDYAFGPDSRQPDVYDNSVKPLIESALSGINVTVLAYGAYRNPSLSLVPALSIPQYPSKPHTGKKLVHGQKPV